MPYPSERATASACGPGLAVAQEGSGGCGIAHAARAQVRESLAARAKCRERTARGTAGAALPQRTALGGRGILVTRIRHSRRQDRGRASSRRHDPQRNGSPVACKRLPPAASWRTTYARPHVPSRNAWDAHAASRAGIRSDRQARDTVPQSASSSGSGRLTRSNRTLTLASIPWSAAICSACSAAFLALYCRTTSRSSWARFSTPAMSSRVSFSAAARPSLERLSAASRSSLARAFSKCRFSMIYASATPTANCPAPEDVNSFASSAISPSVCQPGGSAVYSNESGASVLEVRGDLHEWTESSELTRAAAHSAQKI